LGESLAIDGYGHPFGSVSSENKNEGSVETLESQFVPLKERAQNRNVGEFFGLF